jgi:hypothetical protein
MNSRAIALLASATFAPMRLDLDAEGLQLRILQIQTSPLFIRAMTGRRHSSIDLLWITVTRSKAE